LFIKVSELKQIHKQSITFYKYRLISALSAWAGYIVGSFLLKNIGIVLSILLSFL
jgi:hypothetical protein